MKNILWLASWYPNKLKPFNGDFIERHARAASALNKITVLYLVKDESRELERKYFIEERKYNENCSATILYYQPYSKVEWVEALFSGIRYFIFFAELVRQYIDDHGKPDLLHVHVSWKAGIIAWYCKWKYKLKYVITEHWSGFMPGSDPSYKDVSFLQKFFLKKIFKKAAGVSAVSDQLAQALYQLFNIQKPVVIPNVVDTGLFQPANNNNDIFRFIHISEFNYQKNPEQIFEAISLLKALTADPFQVFIFAPDQNKVIALASKHAIKEMIQTRNYVPQGVLALELNHSDVLILYSRFETFGCVVIEAMASGVPVIVSDIPVMHEIVSDQTGIMVELNNPKLLAEKMLWMMNNKLQFNKDQMAGIARSEYSFEKIAGLFNRFYELIAARNLPI